MQQMFSLVNNLLHSNLETRKRKLIIRTYKVIPLSPNTGILEWVENTIPIGEYLIGNPRNQKNGAHVRYRPNDKSSDQCKKVIYYIIIYFYFIIKKGIQSLSKR